jgi:hypothetical protein
MLIIFCWPMKPCQQPSDGVARDIEPGAEAVLETHARDRFRVDPAPGRLSADEVARAADLLLVGHVHILAWVRMRGSVSIFTSAKTEYRL